MWSSSPLFSHSFCPPVAVGGWGQAGDSRRVPTEPGAATGAPRLDHRTPASAGSGLRPRQVWPALPHWMSTGSPAGLEFQAIRPHSQPSHGAWGGSCWPWNCPLPLLPPAPEGSRLYNTAHRHSVKAKFPVHSSKCEAETPARKDMVSPVTAGEAAGGATRDRDGPGTRRVPYDTDIQAVHRRGITEKTSDSQPGPPARPLPAPPNPAGLPEYQQPEHRAAESRWHLLTCRLCTEGNEGVGCGVNSCNRR